MSFEAALAIEEPEAWSLWNDAGRQLQLPEEPAEHEWRFGLGGYSSEDLGSFFRPRE